MLARMRLGRSRSIVAVLTLGLALAVALVASGLIAPRGSDVALGATTTLTIISETVELSREGSAFAPAEDGAVLGPRDAIRTGPEGRAVLTYFDGSTVSIEPTTQIVIERAESGADGSVVIVMTQRLGRSWHVVATLISGGSSYEVRTPATTASVRGTAFEIALVLEADEVVAVVSTTEGEVVAAKASTAEAPQPERVVVAAGFQANVKRGAPIERPRPQPEPERRVSVDADAVVDPLGRFNGRTPDGRIVLQTPGAKIEGGRIVLPNVPDGKLSTIVHDSYNFGADAFLTKLNAAGSAALYSTYLGGSPQTGNSGFDEGRGVAADALGNTWVVGRTDSTNFPTAAPTQATNGGSFDAFLARFDTKASGAASLPFSTYYGGSGAEEGLGIGMGPGGNVTITGWTSGTNLPTTTPLQPSNAGSVDVFVENVLYGVESSSDGLSRINAVTGAVSFIGRLDPDVTKLTTPVAMAVRPSDRTIFVWNNSDGNTNETIVTTGVVLTVDRCTGLATKVAPNAAPQGILGALAFSPQGTLYGVGGELYTISTGTGVKTLVGSLGLSVAAADFDPVTGTLYGVELTPGGSTTPPRLVTINTATGAATVVATLGTDVGRIGSIVFGPRGGLIGSAFGGTLGNILFDLDKTTGSVQNVRSVTGGFAPQGLGFSGPCGDTTAPAWPSGAALTTFRVGPKLVGFSWPTAQDNVGVTSYKVFQNGVLRATLGGSITSYRAGTLTSNTAYTFSVQACDAAGNCGTGPSLSITTPIGLNNYTWPSKDQPGGDATRTLKTRVEERGKQPVEVEERVRRSSGERTVSGVELKRSDPGKAPEIRKLDDDEKRRLSTGKVGQTPTPRRRAEPPRGKPAGPEDARRTDAPGAGQPIQRPGRGTPQAGPAGQRTPQGPRTPEPRRTPEVKRQDQQRATATPGRRTGSATAAPQRRTESPRTQPPARRTGTPTAAPQRRTESPRTQPPGRRAGSATAAPQRRTESPRTQPPARP